MIKKQWKLFLDDQCDESNDNTNRPIRDCKLMYPNDKAFIQTKSVHESKKLIKKHGCPIFISFDHDLGENQETGYDLAKWLNNQDLDSNFTFIPSEFNHRIHSANPIGGKILNQL